jgi:hypothetical protein
MSSPQGSALSVLSVLSALLVGLLSSAVSAEARDAGSCAPAAQAVRRGGWVLDASYGPSVTPSASEVEYVTTQVSHMATTSGFVTQATGTAQIRDGTSNTLMIAERWPALLSCDDVNLDGIAGIAMVQFSLRNALNGAIVPVAIVPLDGELDSAGEEAVTISIGGRIADGVATVRAWVYGTELPRDR